MSLVQRLRTAWADFRETSAQAKLLDTIGQVATIREDLNDWNSDYRFRSIANKPDYLQRNSLTQLLVTPIDLSLRNTVYRESHGLTHAQAMRRSLMYRARH